MLAKRKHLFTIFEQFKIVVGRTQITKTVSLNFLHTVAIYATITSLYYYQNNFLGMFAFTCILLRSIMSIILSNIKTLKWKVYHFCGCQTLLYTSKEYTEVKQIRFLISLWCKHWFETVPISGAIFMYFVYMWRINGWAELFWFATAAAGLILLAVNTAQYFFVYKRRDIFLIPMYILLDFTVRNFPIALAIHNDALIGCTLLLFAYLFEVAILMSLQERLNYIFKNFVFSFSSVFSCVFLWFLCHAHIQEKGVRLTLTWQIFLSLVVRLCASVWVLARDFSLLSSLLCVAGMIFYWLIFCFLIFYQRPQDLEDDPAENMVVLEAGRVPIRNQGVEGIWLQYETAQAEASGEPMPTRDQFQVVYEQTPQQRQNAVLAFLRIEEAIEALVPDKDTLDFARFKMCVDLLDPAGFPQHQTELIFNFLDVGGRMNVAKLKEFLQSYQQQPEYELARQALMRAALDSVHVRKVSSDNSLVNFFRPRKEVPNSESKHFVDRQRTYHTT